MSEEQTIPLTAETASLAAPLETGITTSTVKQTWGCGHAVWRVNGDCLYHTCPWCYVKKMSA